jgi:hypothetical protein
MFLESLHKYGFNNLFNVDPSHENEENIIFKAIIGNFPDALDIDHYRNYFSCIIGQHFLEHVANPLNVLKGARDLLADYGELWIEVPDIETSVLVSYYQTGIIYPLHLSYFTKASLKTIGEKAGLYLESIENIQHYGNSIWAKFTKKPNNKTFYNLKESKLLIPTIKTYFEDIKAFAEKLPKEILCWGAAERAHTTYGIISSFGIKAISIFDSNPEIKGLYICGIDTPILGPESFPDYPNDLLILSPPNHKSIIEGIKNKLSKNSMIHIPLIGHYTFEKYEEKFFNK